MFIHDLGTRFGSTFEFGSFVPPPNPEKLMPFGNQIPDKTIQKQVDRKLLQKCSGSPGIRATVRSGDATITGMIKLESERKPIVRCVSAVQGVRRVVDQLQVAVRKKTNP